MADMSLQLEQDAVFGLTKKGSNGGYWPKAFKRNQHDHFRQVSKLFKQPVDLSDSCINFKH